MADIFGADHPLTDEHLQQIKDGLAGIDKALKQIALAERAGIDMSATKGDAIKAQTQLQNIRQVYFPGR